MKIVFSCCLVILLTSCFNTSRNNIRTEQLNQRILLLDQRIDSLISSVNTNLNGLKDTGNSFISYSTVRKTNRCQAITKKGTQCKRSAKNNYCWQHGG